MSLSSLVPASLRISSVSRALSMKSSRRVSIAVAAMLALGACALRAHAATFPVISKPTPVSFGSQAVGSAQAQTTVTFNVTGGGTLSTTPLVLTTGQANLDYTLGTGSTCTGTVSVGTCTVKVIFTPRAPGQRLGAVVLQSGGSTVATALLYGTGTGPAVVFPGNTAINTLGASGSFSQPYSVAVDGAGNVYVADTYHSAVKEIVAVGGSIPASNPTINTLGPSGTFLYPEGVAVDGAGNVYVADTGHSLVKEIMAVGGSIPASNPTINTLGPSGTFSYPGGVAVDGAGNVYVADTDHSAVKEIVAVGGSIPASKPTINTLGPSGTFSDPEGVAVDGAGNVYVADYYQNAVKEILAVGGSIPASNPTINTLGPSGTFSYPEGVAVDGAGNVYVADGGHNAVREIVAVGGSIPASNPTINTLGLSTNFSKGVAVDGAGNVYVADTGNSAVKEIPLATPPSLSFASTAVGATSSDSPQTVTLQNIGNSLLTFANPTSGGNPSISAGFSIGNSSSCPQLTQNSSAGTLASGDSCTNVISFTPVVTGSPVSGSLVTTDNTLNVAGSTQSVALSGTATADAFTVTGVSPSSGPAAGGTTVTITGTGLNAATQVTFGGVAATGVVFNSASSLTATSPAGTGTVDVTVTTGGSTSATSAADQFTYAVALAKLVVTGYPAFAPTGSAQSVTVTAYDANNNVITGFTGTVTITSSDPAATLPAPYAYTPADMGTHVFSVTLNTAGTQSITATSGSISGSETGIVSTGYVVAISTPNNTLSKFTEDGTPFNSSGYMGGGGAQYGAAVDAAGDVFSVSSNNSVLVEFNSAGAAVSGSGYSGGGINAPLALAVDGAGQVWVVNNNSSLSVFTNAGTAVTPSTGYASGGYNGALGIAIDISGNVWVANLGSGNVIKVLGGAAPAAPLSTALTNGTLGARP